MKTFCKKLLACCLAVCMVVTLCVSGLTFGAAMAASVVVTAEQTELTTASGSAVVEVTTQGVTIDEVSGIAAARINLNTAGLKISQLEIVSEDKLAMISYADENGEPVLLEFNKEGATEEDGIDPENPTPNVSNVVPKVENSVFTYLIHTESGHIMTAAVTLKITFVIPEEVEETTDYTVSLASAEACYDAETELLEIDDTNASCTLTVAKAHEHNFVGEVTTQPTCTEPGVKTFTCECGEDTYTEAIDALGHTEVIDEAVAATCTTTGLTEGKHCSVCNEVIVAQEEVAALGHAWNEGIIDPDATCTDEGVRTYTCGTCGDTYTEAVSAKGHTEVDVEAVAPTCTETGLTAGKKCSVCGAFTVPQEEVAALGHTEVVDEAVAATCTETGLTEGKHCSVCNEVLVAQEEVAALGHDFGENLEFCANNCGTANPDYVAPCDHNDANQDGICDTCDYENIDDTLEFLQKGMNLGADISGVFVVRKSNKTSPYVSFKVIAEKEGVKSELEIVANNSSTSYTTYGFGIAVAPKEMVDIIETRIVGITAEGEAFISNVDSWSIKQGLIELMDGYSTKTTEDAFNRLVMCANMLNYGAEAQKNFDYKTENLATDNLPEKYAQYIITETPEMAEIPATDDTGATAPLLTIGFNLAARVQILPCFKVPKADAKEIYSAEITQVHTAPDGTVTTKNYTIEGADCLKQSTTFGVYIENLASNDLRDVLTVTLYKNGQVVSATHTFSAESVAKSKIDSNPTLYTALMVYGDCARAVFG